VHNDACYPAIMVIGQLINKFISGGADPDRSTVAITQTGGMCRATNYVGLLRKGLKDAGYPQVPVLAVSAQGLETNPGFKLTAGMATGRSRPWCSATCCRTCCCGCAPTSATRARRWRCTDAGTPSRASSSITAATHRP
jgi:hypothetical protein